VSVGPFVPPAPPGRAIKKPYEGLPGVPNPTLLLSGLKGRAVLLRARLDII
jgi:hypothetical protein